MDKNSIIGFVLIFLIMLGFFGYQSRQVQKQQAYQAQLDSIAAAEAYAQWQQDSIWRANNPEAAAAAEALENVENSEEILRLAEEGNRKLAELDLTLKRKLRKK